MAPWFYKIAIYVFFVNAFIGLFATPQFNPWDKYYSSPNQYFNKTNMSVSTMTQSQADMYYGRNANASTNQSATFGFTSIFNMSESGVLGWLVAVFTMVLQIFIFIFYWAVQCYTFVGTQIVLWFGSDFIPFAIIIQGGIDIAFTYAALQFLLARGGRVYD